MNTRGFSRPQNRSQIVRIFDPIKEHEKWLFTSRLCPIKNLLGGVVGFRGNERNDTLVMSAWHQSIERRRRFDVNGNSLRLCQLRKVEKLPIGPKHQQPLQRA